MGGILKGNSFILCVIAGLETLLACPGAQSRASRLMQTEEDEER